MAAIPTSTALLATLEDLLALLLDSFYQCPHDSSLTVSWREVFEGETLCLDVDLAVVPDAELRTVAFTRDGIRQVRRISEFNALKCAAAIRLAASVSCDQYKEARG